MTVLGKLTRSASVTEVMENRITTQFCNGIVQELVLRAAIVGDTNQKHSVVHRSMDIKLQAAYSKVKRMEQELWLNKQKVSMMTKSEIAGASECKEDASGHVTLSPVGKNGTIMRLHQLEKESLQQRIISLKEQHKASEDTKAAEVTALNCSVEQLQIQVAHLLALKASESKPELSHMATSPVRTLKYDEEYPIKADPDTVDINNSERAANWDMQIRSGALRSLSSSGELRARDERVSAIRIEPSHVLEDVMEALDSSTSCFKWDTSGSLLSLSSNPVKGSLTSKPIEGCKPIEGWPRKRIVKMLQQILLAVAAISADVGDKPGINHVSAFCLRWHIVGDSSHRLADSELTSKVTKIMRGVIYDLGLVDFYTGELGAVATAFTKLEQHVDFHLPGLSAHFKKEGVSPYHYAGSWFLTLFTDLSTLPMYMVAQVWDWFVIDGWDVIHKVAVAILSAVEAKMLVESKEGILLSFTEIPALLSTHSDTELIEMAKSIEL